MTFHAEALSVDTRCSGTSSLCSQCLLTGMKGKLGKSFLGPAGMRNGRTHEVSVKCNRLMYTPMTTVDFDVQRSLCLWMFVAGGV